MDDNVIKFRKKKLTLKDLAESKALIMGFFSPVKVVTPRFSLKEINGRFHIHDGEHPDLKPHEMLSCGHRGHAQAAVELMNQNVK